MFGMCDTSTTPATGYMEIVQTRDAATLLPIIRDHVHPGIIITNIITTLTTSNTYR